MSKKKLAKRIIIPIVLVALIATTAIILFAVNKKPKTTPPIVSVVTQERDIELEIQNAVINHNVAEDFNGNYVYKSIKDIAFAKEMSEENKSLIFKHITGRPDENAFRVYLNNIKNNQKNEFISLIDGQYTKTIDSKKVNEGFYYGNLDKSYVYIENSEGSIELDGNKYSIELEISQTAYWLNKTIITSPTTLYVREKFMFAKHSDNFVYVTYVYEMIDFK